MSADTQKRNEPRHIGIIMDGNGRWANQKGLSRIKGHQQGVETCRRIIEACKELNVQHLTLYAFSAENWKRPESEVNALMELLEFFLQREAENLIKQKIRLRAIGRLDALPVGARKALTKAIEETSEFSDWNLTLALNYSSRNEVVDAARNIGKAIAKGQLKPEDLDWETFAQSLYTRNLPDPDLIIRTSGETRLSNFLVLQGAYAELYFTETYWPDFTKTHLEEAIAYYHRRERRFGKTGEQLSSENSKS